MLFMVIEQFRNQDAKSVYRRFQQKGRLLPNGVEFLNSWVAADLGRCFQLMECNDITPLQRWVAEWSDLIEFEIVPVVSGKETAAALAESSAGVEAKARVEKGIS
jgi:hypothetical protein